MQILLLRFMVRAIFHLQDIRRNVLSKLIEICMDTPCWWPSGWAPTWRPEINRNICQRVLLQKREYGISLKELINIKVIFFLI